MGLDLEPAPEVTVPSGAAQASTWARALPHGTVTVAMPPGAARPAIRRDRKSTRLNSSHQIISYAVFCLKKKKVGFAVTVIRRHPGASYTTNALSHQLTGEHYTPPVVMRAAIFARITTLS